MPWMMEVGIDWNIDRHYNYRGLYKIGLLGSLHIYNMYDEHIALSYIWDSEENVR